MVPVFSLMCNGLISNVNFMRDKDSWSLKTGRQKLAFPGWKSLRFLVLTKPMNVTGTKWQLFFLSCPVFSFVFALVLKKKKQKNNTLLSTMGGTGTYAAPA